MRAVSRLLLHARTRGRVALGAGVRLGRGVRFDLAGPGRVQLGDGCALGDGCRLHVRGGLIVVGPGARLGERCAIVAHERVEVGPRALLADGVALVDAGPVDRDPERPVREQGVEVAPVRVGAGAALGRGVVVERGVTVGDGARVGAHAVVARDVPAGATVHGVPAQAAAAPALGAVAHV